MKNVFAPVPATALLAGVLLAAAGAPSAEAQDPRMWLFGNVSFPARADSFSVLGTERWLQPERGTLLRYGTGLAPDATIDVHVQPLPLGRSDPQAVREELQRTLGELRRYAAEGATVAIDTVHAVAVEAGGWTYDGHHVAATVRRRAGTTGHSLAYVFAKPPSFVKIRITHAAAARSALDPRIRAFVAEILARVESFQEGDPAGGP